MKRIARRALSLVLTCALLLAFGALITPPQQELTVSAAVPAPPKFSPQTDKNNIIGKTVTGYQGWFGRGWYHNWSNVSDKTNLFFEMWPDATDYPDNARWVSTFKTLNNGEPAYLFDSTNQGVVDTHFQWMQEYGIDCAAVQRFRGYRQDATAINQYKYIKEAAEAHDRLFYMMYDLSGTSGMSAADVLNYYPDDFVKCVENNGWVTSPNYAHADGKPVVCLWGFSGNLESRYIRRDAAIALIDWFQNRGYYVIIGAEDSGFAGDTTDYADVYLKADMISPWYVGRHNIKGMTGMRNTVVRDKGFCDKNNIAYMPVIFPGFSWVNLKAVDQYNQIPRMSGAFLWRQAIILAQLGCDTVYFAMFDEYDEATALMKAASDYTMLPKSSHYYLTLAADGSWLSSDYYLRLAGAIGKMLDDVADGKVDPVDIILSQPVPYSEGPVYYRNGFTYYNGEVADADGVKQPVQLRLDPGLMDGVTSITAVGDDLISLAKNAVEETKTDGWIYRVAGESEAGEDEVARLHRTISPTNFVVAKDTVLTYRLRANDTIGQNVYVNLQFEDGELLSRLMVSVKDTAAKVGEWVEVTVPISNDFVGKTVTAIVLSCETADAGAFSADLDDILIEIGEEKIGDFEAEAAPPEADPVLYGDANRDEDVTTADARQILLLAAELLTEDDVDMIAADVNLDGYVTTFDARLILQYVAELIPELPFYEAE